MSNYGHQILQRPIKTESNSIIPRVPSAITSTYKSENNRLNQILQSNNQNNQIGPCIVENSLINEINSRIQNIEGFENTNGSQSYSYAIIRNKNKYSNPPKQDKALPSIPAHLYYNT